MIKKQMRTMLFFAVLLLCMMTFTATGVAEILTLPTDMSGGIAPYEDCYIYEEGQKDPVGYEDPSISVRFEKGRYKTTNYIMAYIKVADASQVRTAFAQAYNNTSTEAGSTIAKRVKAVIAINADYHVDKDRKNKGLVIRQGTVYREKLEKCLSTSNKEGWKDLYLFDILLIDDLGDMHILKNCSPQDYMAFQGNIVNAFTFGPGLIIDGVAQTGYENIEISNMIAAEKKAQRMVLAQTGEKEYIVITTEGPEDEYGAGLTLQQLTDLLSERYPQIINAYNLDGGSSSTLVFKKANSSYAKVNGPNNPKVRPLVDIIYFASAWQPDDSGEAQ